MANNEAERESLMRRQVSNWASGNANGSNPASLGDINSRNLQLQQVLAQHNMQQNQSGNSMQQWRLGLNQQPQRFPQTIPGALPNTSMVYNAQTRPQGSFSDSDAAAALAAARSRLAQNQQQNQRADAPLFSGRADTGAAGSAAPTASSASSAASAAAAVLARVRQHQQQNNPQLPNSQPPNPQQHIMQTNPLTDDRWKALTNRPQLTQPLHLPAMPLQPARPPMIGPQMPTPFPNQVPPQMMRPPFSSSPPAPNRPSLLNDQPRLAALMAEYNNRMAPAGLRPQMVPTDFGMPRPMMSPRQTLPMTLPAARPPVPTFPVTTGSVKPAMPTMQTVGSLPANLGMPPNMYAPPRPGLHNLPIPVGGMSLPTSAANGLLSMPTKPAIGMGWPDAHMANVHAGLVRSNSAPPIPPQAYFNPVVHFSQIPNMPQMTGMSYPMMTYPYTEGMFYADHGVPADGGVPDAYSRTSPKMENKEECGPSSTEATDDESKQQQQQRPMSADSMVRRCGSASHGDVEADGHSHRNHQSGTADVF